MATTNKYKDPVSGQIKTVDIDPAFGVELTVPTDETALNVKITGPAGETKVETIGGRTRRD